MIRRPMLVVAAIGVLVASPVTGAAQGSLSLLGFGYPVGGSSTRSQATGASIGGLDAQSTANPAALVLSSRAQGYFQYEPEFRSVRAGGPAVKTTTSRFPLFQVTGRQGRATFGLSYSSFLDRTWSNSYADTQTVAGERIASTVLTSSVGGIAEARGAMAWSFTERVHAGAALQFYPGDNRVSAGRIFDDTARIGSFNLEHTYNFSGTAFSLGAVWLTEAKVALAADLRIGGSLRFRQGDSTVVGRARIPLRMGVTASYEGVPGAIFSARVARERWSDLEGLGSASLVLEDATDIALGTEVLGPRVGSAQWLLRGGYRARGLPFGYDGDAVNERTISGGLGIPIGASRGFLDIALARSVRSADVVRERAWVLSVGVGIRP